MKRHIINVTMTVAALLLLVANLTFAEEVDTKAAPKNKTAQPAKKSKSATNIKLVDINSAGREELKKLPGITDAYADKIIAGRPYPTKARLTTDNILPGSVYNGIKGKIVARQPFKDAGKNAAIYNKK